MLLLNITSHLLSVRWRRRDEFPLFSHPNREFREGGFVDLWFETKKMGGDVQTEPEAVTASSTPQTQPFPAVNPPPSHLVSRCIIDWIYGSTFYLKVKGVQRKVEMTSQEQKHQKVTFKQPPSCQPPAKNGPQFYVDIVKQMLLR